LRTPLASIEGSAKALLQLETQPADSSSTGLMTCDMRVQFINIVAQEAARLRRLIDGVLNYSDTESTWKNLNPQLMSVRTLIQDAVATFGKSNMRPTVTIRLPADSEELYIYADHDAMLEVLRQLIDNADKFSCGREIVVGAEKVSITPMPASLATQSGLQHRVSSCTQLYVQDKGMGIKPLELSHIFERFFRGDDAQSYPGHGLGLSIARNLVIQNNGRIWASSAYGQGSTFYVLLPNQSPSAKLE
jgi:two-component system phosphate regulon sensor histidine kinase PhoR